MSSKQPSQFSIHWEQKTQIAKNNDPQNMPTPRSGHTMSIIGSNVFLFGGLKSCDNNSTHSEAHPTNESYLLKLQGENKEWMQLQPKDGDVIPCARWKHSATQISASEILIFGGFTSMMDRLNDFWIFNAITRRWTEVQLNKLHDREMDEEDRDEETWKIAPRGSHTANVCDNLVYIFGGHGGHEYERQNRNDLHIFDSKNLTCKEIKPKGTPPEPRSGHASCIIDNKMYICGGWNSDKKFQDMFVLDLNVEDTESLTWDVIPKSCLIQPTWNHSLCSIDNFMFIFGGTQSNKKEVEDNEEDVFGVHYSNDLIIYDAVECQREKYTLKDHECMPKRLCNLSMTYYPKESIIYFFGGWSNTWHSDLFSLKIN